MRPLQGGHRITCLTVRKRRQLLQGAPHGLLVLLVQVRPPLSFLEPQGARRRAAPQQTHHVAVAAGRLGEPFPHRRPCAFARRHALSGDDVRLLRRVEPQLVPATVAERVPAVLSQPGPRRVRVAHPPQQIPDDVAGQHAIEVVRLQAVPFELRHRRQRHLRQRPQQRLRRGPVASNVQAERLGRGQEGVHGPVAAVRLAPQGAPEQQLDQRLQFVRALLAGAKLLARDTRQIDDGRPVIRQFRFVERAVDDAAHPDGRTGAAPGVVVAQHEVFLDARQQDVDQRQPLPLRVRPQDRGRPGLAVEGRVPSAELLDQPVENGLRRRTPAGSLVCAHARSCTCSGPSLTASQAAISQPWNTTARPTCRTEGWRPRRPSSAR